MRTQQRKFHHNRNIFRHFSLGIKYVIMLADFLRRFEETQEQFKIVWDIGKSFTHHLVEINVMYGKSNLCIAKMYSFFQS